MSTRKVRCDHKRIATVTAVIDYVGRLEDLMVKTLPADVLASIGPRYRTLREARIDLERVYQSLVLVVREKRDDPDVVLTHLIALAGQALKIADDVAYASARSGGPSTVNPDTAFTVLVEGDEDD